MRPMSTTPPTDETVASISGVAAVTVIVSATFATFSEKSRLMRLADVDDDALAVDVAETGELDEQVCSRRRAAPSGDTMPSASVTAERVKPVVGLVAVTVAPGMAAP